MIDFLMWLCEVFAEVYITTYQITLSGDGETLVVDHPDGRDSIVIIGVKESVYEALIRPRALALTSLECGIDRHERVYLKLSIAESERFIADGGYCAGFTGYLGGYLKILSTDEENRLFPLRMSVPEGKQ
jgi:hypothetical protein